MTSQLAVLMFADIVGYSALMQEDQARTIAAVRALGADCLVPIAESSGGTLLKRMGDGWIFGFGSVASLVDCAMDIQTSLQGRSDLKLRIGCHLGDIVRDDDDIYGTGVNIAQRIQTEAPPGGLMVSEDVYRQLSTTQAETLQDAGIFRLRNIAQPVRLYQWRPARGTSGGQDDVTSIAIATIDFAPADAETAALAGDLRDQLVIRLSRRVGVIIYDAAAKPVDHATYDLRSRLRVAGDRGRLSLTLILRSEGRPVWSESYDGDTSDIFTFCDELLERAEAALRLQTNAFDGDRLAQIADADLSVSELRARAANCFYRVSYDDWAHGRDLVARAIRLNPMDGVALGMEAEAELMLTAARYERMPPDMVARLARNLDTAVEQSPGSDYVFWVRGTFRIDCLNDIAGARSDLALSRDLNPAYIETHELEGNILMREGRFDEAFGRFGRLVDRQSGNPLRPYSLFLCAIAKYCAERFEDAAETARVASDLRPHERGLHQLQALCWQRADRAELAKAARTRAAQIKPQPSITARRPVLPDGFAALAEALNPLTP